MAANGSVGMSGHNFDAFVSSQRTFNDRDLAAKIQEKYWMARQKFLSKIEKNEDSCIVLSDSKLDSKLEVYRSIDRSCARLTNILEDYQNCLYVFANEENSLGILLKECSKIDKTKAGKIQAITGKSLSQSSHQRIRLYMPLLRMFQEMETFHTRAVDDTAETVKKLEDRRDKYRASLLWMKDISERLDPDTYRQLDKFRRVQNQVRGAKKAFDGMQMDVVQKIDLLMASRCNLMNQILAAYQATLLETFERNYHNFRSIEEIIKKEDIYEYEFKTLKQLNPLKLSDSESTDLTIESGVDLLQELDKDSNNNRDIGTKDHQKDQGGTLIDVSEDCGIEGLGRQDKEGTHRQESGEDVIDQLETLFGIKSEETKLPSPPPGADDEPRQDKKDGIAAKGFKANFKTDLLDMGCDEQIANLLGQSENVARFTLNKDKIENLFGWNDEPIAIESAPSQPSSNSAQTAFTSIGAGDFDLMGDMMGQTSTQAPQKSSAGIDLLANELDEIDNSSYFKSLQRLQL